MLFAAVAEAALMWGAFAYVGADLYLRFALSFTLIGVIVATFGIGGLLYAALVPRLVGRFGQTGLAGFGGLLVGLAYLALAFAPVWWIAPATVVAIGLGFYMLHSTLQTNATQMAPQARGTAVALFSSALYVGQSVGVAGGSLLIDRAGAPASSAWRRWGCRYWDYGLPRACGGALVEPRPRATRSISGARGVRPAWADCCRASAEHRPQHLFHEIFQRLGVLHQHRVGERIERELTAAAVAST